MNPKHRRKAINRERATIDMRGRLRSNGSLKMEQHEKLKYTLYLQAHVSSAQDSPTRESELDRTCVEKAALRGNWTQISSKRCQKNQ